MQTFYSEQKTKLISFTELYGNNSKNINIQKDRYKRLSEKFIIHFAAKPEYYFSTPGRTEISGNHTDHNHGKVIAASINLDSITAVSKSDSVVEIFSEGYNNSFNVNLDKLGIIESEASSTNSLIRGIAAGFKIRGLNIGGFKAVITSNVLKGSGLSSSASIEVLIGTIFNHLYNDGEISAEEIAKIGQYAENVYFKKPCGLMDQMACAIGGIISIDFYNPENPIVEKLNFDFFSTGYSLIVVDTEGDHSNLTDDYASIPEEMKSVAKYFGKKFCAEISLDELLNEIKSIRNNVSDRAILRAFHFLGENERVENQKRELTSNNFQKFLDFVNESGNSSFKYLQNIYSVKDYNQQEVSLALAITEKFINQKGKGACRVHGGGFAGTIQVFLPEQLVEEYKNLITKIFSDESVKVLSIRNFGSVKLVLD